MAGTIAQSTNNGLGVAGVAFGATIMPVKVLSACGSGRYAAVASGITVAADNGAQVINMSLGGSAASQTLLDALQHADGLGVTIVAAAGNGGSSTISYPAAYSDYVIADGATRYDETLSYYSNYGQGLSLVAPGGDVTVDQDDDGYGDGVLQQTFSGAVSNFAYYFFQGTSMAAPHVAGVAALVIANGVNGPVTKNPRWSHPDEGPTLPSDANEVESPQANPKLTRAPHPNLPLTLTQVFELDFYPRFG